MLGFVRYFTDAKHHFRYLEPPCHYYMFKYLVFNFISVQSHCIALHYELRNSQLKIHIYQPDAKQENSHFHHRDSCHKLLSGPV